MPFADTTPTDEFIARIPSRLLNGPTVFTTRLPDGSFVRMSYCRACRVWHSMLVLVDEDDDLVLAPIPPISLVVTSDRATA